MITQKAPFIWGIFVLENMTIQTLILGEVSEEIQKHKSSLMHVLKRYLPAISVEYCSELIIYYKLHLHIEVERKDRLGDYHPHLGNGNRISINHNLNPYDFLITFIHELAHHVTFKKSGRNHQPHGSEWKENFKDCMRPIVRMKFFPEAIERPLILHMRNPKYTHSGDVELMKAIMKYDKEKKYIVLDDLTKGNSFKMSMRSKIILIKGEKKRTYIECFAKDSSKKYLVHAIAKVIPV